MGVCVVRGGEYWIWMEKSTSAVYALVEDGEDAEKVSGFISQSRSSFGCGVSPHSVHSDNVPGGCGSGTWRRCPAILNVGFVTEAQGRSQLLGEISKRRHGAAGVRAGAVSKCGDFAVGFATD